MEIVAVIAFALVSATLAALLAARLAFTGPCPRCGRPIPRRMLDCPHCGFCDREPRRHLQQR